MAACHGSRAASLLLERGADPQHGTGWLHPLLCATSQGRAECPASLEGDVEVEPRTGTATRRSASRRSAATRRRSVCWIWCGRVMADAEDGCTPLMNAARHERGSRRCSCGGSQCVEMRDDLGRTALMIAARPARRGTARGARGARGYHCATGRRPCAALDGRTAAHLAAQHGGGVLRLC